MEKPSVAMIGLSHLGIVTLAGLASKSFKLFGFDPDADKVNGLINGNLWIHEPGLKDALEKNLKNISFTHDLDELGKCDIFYISIDVPTDDNGNSSIDAVNSLLMKVAPYLENKVLIILSQVPPGFTRKVATEFPSTKIFYQVETLVFGIAMQRTLFPERYIIGCAQKPYILDKNFKKILEPFGCPILPMSFESAELAKISINMFLVSSVSTSNLLSDICEAIGADWGDISKCLRLDKRIGEYAYLSAGLGISGGNLERDMATITKISKKVGVKSKLVETWIEQSAEAKQWPLRTAQRVLGGSFEGKTIAILGLAYKANTDSTKNAPSLKLISELERCKIQVFDPKAELGLKMSLTNQISQCKDPVSACVGADVVFVLSPWEEFKKLTLDEIRKVMKGRIIIDPYQVLEGQVGSTIGNGFYAVRGRQVDVY